MSITATRKVGSSSSPTRRSEHTYVAGAQSEPFVEMIDTNNNISVRDDLRDNHGKTKQKLEEQESEFDAKLSSKSTYVPSAIEALAASGVYDNIEPQNASRKIGVYDSNQSIIKDEEIERTGRSYLKHFYEKNQPITEVDEFI